MKPDISATRSERPVEQDDAWGEQRRPFLDVPIGHPVRDGIASDGQIWQLGSIAVSRVAVPTVVAANHEPGRARVDGDHWVLACCESAATRVRTGKGDLKVPAGVPFLWSVANCSMAEDLESDRLLVDRVEIYTSGALLRGIVPRLDSAGVTVLDTPLGHLLGDYMLALERRLPDLTENERARLAHALLAMAGTCLAPSAGRGAVARTQIELTRLGRAQQAIRQNLRTPALGPKMLCRLIGVSRSNLYRLFETAGGVTKYVQRQRLVGAYEILRDPTNRKAISAIAEELCFTSASGFSRAFRHEFGCPPNEVRAAAEASLAPFPVPPIRLVPRAAHVTGASRGLSGHAPVQDHPNWTLA